MMKLYYAKSVDGRKTIQFRGETLVCNNPEMFHFVTNLVNEKIRKSEPNNESPFIDMKDYMIVEVEADIRQKETKHEDK